jgi:uncharacterized protein (DUF1800 family)
MSASPPATGKAYLPTSKSWHFARRLTGGATPTLAAQITALGTTTWLDQQLDPYGINDDAFGTFAARFGSQTEAIWSVKDKIDTGKLNGYSNKFAVQCEHVARLCWSKRQLQALLVDFWTNHLNVAALSDGVDESRAHYQHVIRAGALGKFSDLLVAASKHPAMLTFLDNRSSRHEHPNENQGRELLELHTLGVGYYTESMVSNSSRVLTGESVENESGMFEFKPWYHSVGAVQLHSWKNANASRPTGDAVATSMLEYLAHHPDTARRICTKLAQYFVSETPSTALVSSMMKTYKAKDTAIAPVLRTMILSAEFTASIGAVTRRPLESTVASVRLLGLGPDTKGYEGVKALVYALGDAGQSPMNWPTPDGYPIASAAWGSTNATLSRWNFTRSLVNGWYPTTLTRKATLLAWVHPAPLPPTHGQLVDDIALRLFGRKTTDAHRTAVLTFIGATPATALTSSSAAVTWRLGDLVTLLLDSPYHSYR